MPTRSQHVIALDPGQRTGWASARMSVDRLELTDGGVMHQDELAGWLANAQSIFYHRTPKATFPPRLFDVVVVEAWRPRRKNGTMDWIEGDPLLSAQHVGQLRLIARMSKAKYVEFAPMQKPVWTATMPEKLRALDDLSSEQHDRDARMHLWGYFFQEWFTGKRPPQEVVSGV